MTTVSLLEARGIRKRFPGTLALDDVTMALLPGEIHAIMGENGAGKSTLLNILTGAFKPDEGKILVSGSEVEFHNPLDARARGIAIVHQELGLFPDVSVMENILVGIMPRRFGMLMKKRMAVIAERYLERFEADFDVGTIVKNLSVSQQQIVEIVKALATDAAVYIFDEPTSALSVDDARRLFGVLRELRDQGKAIAYVSHKFDEIFELSDKITVLRDGQHIGTSPTSELSPDDVIRMMVGRSLERIYPPKGNVKDRVLMRVSNLNAGSKCRDVSWSLHEGEILGVFGLVGSGRTEIMRSLTGIDPRSSGEIELDGRKARVGNFQDAIELGIYYLTEDRKEQGLFLKMSIKDNIVATHLPQLTKQGMLDRSGAGKLADEVISAYHVRTSSVQQLVGSLSGGNQQKVMIGKWLSKEPRVIILDEPTRGIDVGAKAEVHQLLRKLAADGIGVVVISSELPEIVGLSDRVLVVHQGAVAGILSGEQISDELIMEYASGLRPKSVAR